jgi:hypothetical protein
LRKPPGRADGQAGGAQGHGSLACPDLGQLKRDICKGT